MTIIPAPAERLPDGADASGAGQAAAGSVRPAQVAATSLFAPSDGRFNAPVAAALTRWKEE